MKQKSRVYTVPFRNAKIGVLAYANDLVLSEEDERSLPSEVAKGLIAKITGF